MVVYWYGRKELQKKNKRSEKKECVCGAVGLRVVRRSRRGKAMGPVLCLCIYKKVLRV